MNDINVGPMLKFVYLIVIKKAFFFIYMNNLYLNCHKKEKIHYFSIKYLFNSFGVFKNIVLVLQKTLKSLF